MSSNIIRNSLCALLASTLLTNAQKLKSPSDSSYYYDGTEKVALEVPANSLAALSITLRNPAVYYGAVRINDDYNSQDGTQTLSMSLSRQNSTTDRLSQTRPGYLIYLCDSNGCEEAFLILSRNHLTLTIQTGFDLLDAARSIPSITRVTIRRAQTFGSVFGTGVDTEFTVKDRVYLWDGTGYLIYFLDANGDWRRTGSFFVANDDILYPDEGVFVLRREPSDLRIKYRGFRPRKAQITTMPGPGLHFVSMRYPKDTTIGQLGFENLPGWVKEDRVYLWDGAGWTIYFYASDNAWHKGGSFADAGNDPVLANTALFVLRASSATAAESGNKHALPKAH